jgi:hypothetical protein
VEGVVRRTLSVVVPAFHESECVDEFAHRLALVCDAATDYGWDCIVIENGSLDDTWLKCPGNHEGDPSLGSSGSPETSGWTADSRPGWPTWTATLAC